MHKYKLIRSDRKTLSLTVNTNCEVIVKAPRRMDEKKIRSFVEEHEKWIERSMVEQKRKMNNKVILSDEEIKKLKKLAKAFLTGRTELYSEIMGVKPTSIKITSAQHRFGSCNGKNGICYSYILMLYPQEAIDYVVVHELAHIKYHNHSKFFYEYIENFLPDYKKREKLLSEKQLIPKELLR